MLAYIKGELTWKSPTAVIVEAGGVGYRCFISLHTYARLEALERARVLTYLHVSPNDMSFSLYGFADEEERALFVQLIGVSGIGPSTAQVLLSTLTPEEIRQAIIAENEAAFKPVKGIGPKTAKRMILDLKDKLLKAGAPEGVVVGSAAGNTLQQEALSALLNLGIAKPQALKVLRKVQREHPALEAVEELVRLALKEL